MADKSTDMLALGVQFGRAVPGGHATELTSWAAETDTDGGPFIIGTNRACDGQSEFEHIAMRILGEPESSWPPLPSVAGTNTLGRTPTKVGVQWVTFAPE